MPRILHSSDLHLGKPFGGVPEAIRHRLREARHRSIARLAEAARSHDAPLIVLAGDTFDAETPARATVRQALAAMAADPALHWILLPGNHDSLAAAELWRQLAADAPSNVTLIMTAAPLTALPGLALLPAPVTTRRPGRDLTEDLSQATPEGLVRVGLAHGPVTDFADTASPGTIPPDRAARAGLDYLALGDWHGQVRIGPATWYSGSPEATGFKHDLPAGALVVDLPGPNATPTVTPVETETLHWRGYAPLLTPSDDAAALLAAALPAPATRRDTLLAFRPTGRLSLAARTALDRACAALADDLGHLDADLGTVAVEQSPEDLDQIDRAGALRAAADSLLSRSNDPELGAADRRTARDALARLYAFATEDTS